MKKRTFLGLMATLPLSQLTACGSGNSGGNASVRLINASPGYTSLDFWVDSTKEISAVTFGTTSAFTDVTSGSSVTTSLNSVGSGTDLLKVSRSLSSGKTYSLVAYGWDGALKSVLIPETEDAADSGETKFSVLNTATDAGSLDVYLTAQSDSLESSTPVRAGVDGGTRSAFSAVSSGSTYRLRVTAKDDNTDLRLDVSNVVLPSEGVVTLILTPTPGGVLVNGMTLQQGGSLTQQFNTKARARVVANVAGGADVTISAGSTSLASGSISPAIKDYVLIEAGTVNFNASVDGNSVQVANRSVAVGEDLTLLVTGSAGAATVKIISDDNRLPTVSTKYKIRLIHGSNLLANENLELDVDLTPEVEDLSFGQASDFVSIPASTSSDLTVSSLSSLDPVITLTDQTMAAKGVYTMFVYDTAAGAKTARLRKER